MDGLKAALRLMTDDQLTVLATGLKVIDYRMGRNDVTYVVESPLGISLLAPDGVVSPIAIHSEPIPF